MRPLGVADPESLVFLYQSNEAQDGLRSGTSPANFYDWRREARSFDGIAGYIWKAAVDLPEAVVSAARGRRW